MYSEEAIYVYEKLLAGEIKNFSPYFLDISKRKERVSTIFKYLIENKLNMSPEQALDQLTLEMISNFKLAPLIKHIHKGKPLPEKEICLKILKYVYPTLSHPTNEEMAILLYKDILEGKVKNFPKCYFWEGVIGEKRAIACLRYLCLEVVGLKEDEIVEHFKSKSLSEAEKFLRKYKLWTAADTLFLTAHSFIETAFSQNERVNF